MVELNLLPKAMRRRRRFVWGRLVAIALSILTVGVTGFLQLTTQMESNHVLLERDRAQARLRSLQPFVLAESRLKAEVEELQKLHTVESTLETEKIFWTRVLSAVISKLPTASALGPDIQLRSVMMRQFDPTSTEQPTYEDKDLDVELVILGRARSLQEIERLIKAFEESPGFGIHFERTIYNAELGVYDFDATVGVASLVLTPTQGGSEARGAAR